MTDRPPFFSIVIPTLNEARYLPNLLGDLAKQSCTSFEVIIADGMSTDQTVKKAQQFFPAFSLTVLVSPQANVSLQRNLGANAAQGEWILFMDADNRLPSYFLLGCRYQLERHPKVKAFTTWMDAKHYRNRDETAIATTYNLGLHAYSLLNKPTAVGALIGAHRSVTAKIKFRTDQAHFEDYDYFIQVKKHRFHYAIFRDPTYVYSMRRFEKEGTLKMMRLMAQANINSLLGRTNEHVLNQYQMSGGSSYESTTTTSLSFFSKLSGLLKTAPRSELQRIQAALSKLLEP